MQLPGFLIRIPDRGWEQSRSLICRFEPVLNYQIELPPDCDIHKMLLNLKELEEEEPELHIVWEERLVRSMRS